MKKQILKFVLYFISLFCIFYYTAKYYYENCLTFNKGQILCWTIIMVVITISLTIGILNSIKLAKITKQNEDLKCAISYLSKQIEKYHYSEMSNVNSVMECVLDLDK